MSSRIIEQDYSVQDAADNLPDDLFGMLDEDDYQDEPQDEEEVVEVDDEEDDEQEEEDVVEDGDSEEDEGDSEEVDPDSDGSGEDSTPDEDGSDKLFEVQIGDDTYEVNLEELKHGYLRGEDFVRQTTEFEAAKAAWEEEASNERSAAIADIEDVRREFAIKTNEFENVDWNRLKADDPQEYVIKRAQYAEFIDQRGRLEVQRTALQKLEQKHNEIKQRAYIQKQSELVRHLIPEWADDAKRPQLQKDLVAYGLQQGLSQGEVESLSDARVLALLNKARLYDNSLKKQKEVSQKRTPKEVQTAIKPGSGSDRSAPTGKRVKAAEARFKSDGSLRNTADYLDAIGFELPTLK